jgi:integrase
VFVVPGKFYNITKKYMDLRSPDMEQFFLNYQNGKCYKQVVGINKIGEQPKIIAQYLKLPNPELFTGHCFRRTGATILADAGVR